MASRERKRSFDTERESKGDRDRSSDGMGWNGIVSPHACVTRETRRNYPDSHISSERQARINLAAISIKGARDGRCMRPLARSARAR